MFRQELTSEAIKKVEKKRGKGLGLSPTDTENENRDWDAVDEEIADIEKERTGGVLEPMSDGESEYETPIGNSHEGTSYMPIQRGSNVPQEKQV